MLELLLGQLKRYPQAGIMDLVKALYQAEFGNGHFVINGEDGLRLMLEELAACPENGGQPLVEPLGEAFARVHLGAPAQFGLSLETLQALFALSANTPAGSMENFLLRLDALEAMVTGGLLPFNPASSQAALSAYREAGCPPARHTPAFREAYAPAYRVIRLEYAKWLPAFAGIDSLLAFKEPLTIAIEGGSASGKTSLAALLKEVYQCNVFHMDDFFLQAHQRTPERFQEPGGNVDHERFLTEVLMPLQTGQAFSYRPFNCQTMAFDPAVLAVPGRLNVIEGAYSLHPRLEQAYDFSVFLDIDPNTQARRILKRNGPVMQRRFLEEWIPLEERYFEQTAARGRADLLIEISD